MAFRASSYYNGKGEARVQLNMTLEDAKKLAKGTGPISEAIADAVSKENLTKAKERYDKRQEAA